MERSKFDIPYELLKKTEPLIQANLDIIELTEHPNTYYAFKAINSDECKFFFYKDGKKALGNYKSGMFVIQCKPSNSSTPTHSLHQGSVEHIAIKFKEWVELVKSIIETPSILDKDFEIFYTDHYFSELKIIDPYADLTPFDPDQQHLILDYLGELKLLLSNYESDQNTIEETLIPEISELEETINEKTKNQVMKSLSKIFGKLYCFSRSLGNDLYKEAKKKLFGKLIDWGINYGPKLIQSVSELLQNNQSS